MKPSIKLGLMGLSFLLLTSCAQEEPMSQTPPEQSPIEKMLVEFKSSVTPPTRQAEPINIVSVDTKYYTTDANDSIVETVPTRAENDNTFDVSTVTLRVGDNYGYALLSTHPKINSIFFYTENGTLSDTAFIAPVKRIVEIAPRLAYQELITEKSNTRVTEEEIIVHQLVRYQWHQKAPFNRFSKACSCKKCAEIGGHMPIGCIPVAVAQTIATIGVFPGTFYGNKDIPFSQLGSTSFNMRESEKMHVGHFLHEIALGCQVKFGCSASSSNLKAAWHYLKDLGYSCDYVEGSIKPDRVIQELKKGYPHLIAGTALEGGHAWVIDGIKYVNDLYMYHCNWGYGGVSDAWMPGYCFVYDDKDNNRLITFDKHIKNIYINSIPSNN